MTQTYDVDFKVLHMWILHCILSVSLIGAVVGYNAEFLVSSTMFSKTNDPGSLVELVAFDV
jgi:hypothetical protein